LATIRSKHPSTPDAVQQVADGDLDPAEAQRGGVLPREFERLG
jgi:hypothetical protein